MRRVGRRRCTCPTAFATVVTSSSSYRSRGSHDTLACPIWARDFQLFDECHRAWLQRDTLGNFQRLDVRREAWLQRRPCRRRPRLRGQRMRCVGHRRCTCPTAFATVVTSSSSYRSRGSHDTLACPIWARDFQLFDECHRAWLQRDTLGNFQRLDVRREAWLQRRPCRRRPRLRGQRMRCVGHRRCTCPTAFATVVTSSSSYRSRGSHDTLACPIWA
ncbi:hypothetical protein SAMN05216605_115123 [Pseudomonas abietaniphila]|uniref:Uncharacterized protein n=1 Tax=Pseudomonas abietaniphila TaxID=89065 RepID=A0A1G8M9K2_9PSED|nr:hypothetical protein SAMN05216605_115123 [Pseudomonas abietaniphila]